MGDPLESVISGTISSYPNQDKIFLIPISTNPATLDGPFSAHPGGRRKLVGPRNTTTRWIVIYSAANILSSLITRPVSQFNFNPTMSLRRRQVCRALFCPGREEKNAERRQGGWMTKLSCVRIPIINPSHHNIQRCLSLEFTCHMLQDSEVLSYLSSCCPLGMWDGLYHTRRFL